MSAHIFHSRGFLSLFFLCLICAKGVAKQPQLLLAEVYNPQDDIPLSQYWVSEKYDGVRALWDGKQLISRQGNVYHAPAWFTRGFPQQHLDGELWIARGQFERLVSTVQKAKPVDSEWQQVRYMVFELPYGKGTFTDRLQTLRKILDHTPSPYIQLVPQYQLQTHQQLMAKLVEVTRQGAEGLMLHRGDALYTTGRSDDLLKVKRYQDDEAVVMQHLPGKGKYRGMMGALQVRDKHGRLFKIGSGFTDEQRRHPPPVGTLITYKYYGLTKKGIPRFASFLRIRLDKNPEDK